MNYPLEILSEALEYLFSGFTWVSHLASSGLASASTSCRNGGSSVTLLLTACEEILLLRHPHVGGR